MRHFSTILIFLLCILNEWDSLLAQTFQPRMLEVDSMQKELAYIEMKLNEVHPEPYHYQSKEAFEEELSELKSSLAPMTLEQWYVKLAALVASLHDGHTCIIYNTAERERYFKQGGTTLPFFVKITDDKRIVIGNNFTGEPALDSATLLEINQHPASVILDDMRQLTFGESEVFRNSQISRTFSRMFWLLHGHSDSVSLSLQLKNGDMRTEKYACITESQYNEFVKRDFPQAEKRMDYHMSLSLLENSCCALLTLYDFNVYKGYKDSIERVFQTIKEKQIDTLFIDIRKNPGGKHYITEQINHYLLDTPWVLVSKAKIRMSDEFYEVFPKSIRWFARILPKKPSLKLAAATMTKNTKIRRTVKYRDPLTKQLVYEIHTRPKQNYSKKQLYKGKLFLLTDRNSYSMSGMFAAIMKDYGRAVIVGEETGGLANPHGSNISVQLAYSKFHFTVSTSRAYRPSGIFDHAGVKPDIPIPYKQLSLAKTPEQLLQLLPGE